MNEESGRGRHFYRVSKRRRRLFWIAFVVLLLAALLALRPAYRWLKAKRADSLAANAEQFVQQKNPDDTILSSLQKIEDRQYQNVSDVTKAAGLVY